MLVGQWSSSSPCGDTVAWYTDEMDDKINLREKRQLLDGPYRPGMVARLNDYKVLVVKAQGPFVWHTHCPKADAETHALLIEPLSTVNTGDAGGDRTVEPRTI